MPDKLFSTFAAELPAGTVDALLVGVDAGIVKRIPLDTYATQAELDALVISGGGISVASSAETITGTNNTKAVSPAGHTAREDTIFVVLRPSGDATGATDTAAITAAINKFVAGGVGGIRFTKGRFYVTSTIDFTADAFYNVVVEGSGHAGYLADTHGTQIVMLTNNVPIMKVRGAVIARDFSLIYNTQQTTAGTAAIGLSMNNLAGAALENISVWNAHIGFGVPQVGFLTSGYNATFNTYGAGLRSYKASFTHFDFRNFNGGGTNCRFGPLYINGGGSLDFVTPGQSCNYGLRAASALGYEFGAMSVDGLEVVERVVDVPTGDNMISFDTFRMEAVNVKKDGDGFIGLGGVNNVCKFNIVEVRNTKWTPAVANSMYIFRTNATRSVLHVGSLTLRSDCAFGASGVRRALFNTAPDAGSDIRFEHIYDALPALSDTIWNDSITTLLQPVKVWNGTTVNEVRRAGRTANTHRMFVATAIPTAGTFAVDDELIMDVITDGKPTAYRCVTAGTPGTWRPIAQTVKMGTTANRPTLVASDVGVQYMDTTLAAAGKSVWWNGTNWVDATGVTV